MVLLVVALFLDPEREGATANIRISFICLKMNYFICNIFDVSSPTTSKLFFPFGGRLLEFFVSSKQVSGFWKPSFLQCGQVLGLRFSAVVSIVSLLAFCPNLLVRFVTSAVSLAFVVTKDSLLVVSAGIAAVSCSSTTFSVVAAAQGCRSNLRGCLC